MEAFFRSDRQLQHWRALLARIIFVPVIDYAKGAPTVPGQSPIISETTSDSRHQHLKVIGRAALVVPNLGPCRLPMTDRSGPRLALIFDATLRMRVGQNNNQQG
jgi:hypothetical protein